MGYHNSNIKPKNTTLIDIEQFLKELREKEPIAVDFDGVIAHYDGEWRGEDYVGDYYAENRPKWNLQRLMDNGYRVIIYTCRSKLEPVEKFLSKHKVPYHHINENPYQPYTISEKKVYAKWYIDDRNPHHKGLTEAVDEILKGSEEDEERNA